MKTAEFLAHLRSLDILLTLQGDRLRCNAPKGALTPEIREALAARKAEILDLLRATSDPRRGADSHPLSFAQTEGDNLRLSAPKGVLTPVLQAEIADRKAELLALLLAEHGESLSRLVPRPRTGAIPLSSAQERLWVLDQFTPGNTAYNLPIALRLHGALDPSTLTAALEALTRRHESLRTTFFSGPSGAFQVIGPPQPVSLPLIDLSTVGSTEQAAEAARLAAEEALRPFDLSRGPLLRARLLRLSASEHVFVLTTHHIVSDGWSMGLLLRDLSLLYEALRANRPSPLPDLPIQYADFALWEREQLQGDALERKLGYWCKQLRGPLPVLDLPSDFPRPPVQTYRGASEQLRMPAPTAAALAALCREKSATPFMGLLAAFALLLHRLTGQQDLIIGAPVAGRDQVALEELIGLFVNTLGLRIDCSGEPSFRELLGRVREVCVGAYENQSVPFEYVLQAIHAERDSSRTPVFQVFFNMLRFPRQGLPWSDLLAERFPLPEVGAKFDLTLYVDDDMESPCFTAVYNADLFTARRMHELLNQLGELLQQVTATPDAALGDYSLMTARARLALPEPTCEIRPTWEGSIPDQLAAMGARHAERTAIEEGYGHWSYGELEARTGQLAQALHAGGIRAGDVVAILGHRSAALSLAVLGVLKAGAAFLILDPAYPAKRLAAYLAAVRPRGFLQLEAAGSLPRTLEECLSGIAFRLVLPRTAAEAATLLASVPRADLDAPGPDDPAYVTFTSGSTGEPKGILAGHRPLSHFLAWQARTFDMTSADRFSLLSGLSHDPLLRDLFAPIWVGGTLCVPAPDSLEAPRQLVDWLRRERVSIIHLTPAVSQLIGQVEIPKEAGDETPLLAIRWAFFGGDILTRRHVAVIRRLAPTAGCVNFYGATETPQAMGYAVVEDSIPGEGEKLPVGCGIADVQLLILTPSQRLAGIGEIGEICIRTPYLATGYLDPRLTQERFSVSPFTGDPHDRIYRTGDLGRYRPDGVVDCIGRKDRQVKVRGFRIEPGEIEAALAAHPDVHAAVVLPRPDGEGETRLVAYLTGANSGTLRPADLCRYLAELVPAPMIPAAFVPLNALPLTPNGKVDQRVLASLELSRSVERRERVPPGDAVEHQIAQIWEDVLGCGPVGIDDNFFDLGGHSLLAVRMIERVEQVCGQRLPVSTLFTGATIRHLVGALLEQSREIFKRPLMPVQAGGSRLPFFFLHGNYLGGGFYCRELARHVGPEQPFYVFHPHGLDGGPVPTTIEAMADDYLRRLRAFRPNGPYLLGGFCSGGLVAFEMARRLRAQGERVDFLLAMDSRACNVRFRWLHFTIRWLGTACRLSPENQQQIFLVVRWLLGFVSGNLKACCKDPGDVLRNVYRRLRRDLATYHTYSHLDLAHGRAIRSYVAPRYPGRITVFLSEDRVRDRYDRDWLGMAEEVDVHLLPGTHSASITRYVHVVAGHLRACLDAAQGRDVPGAEM